MKNTISITFDDRGLDIQSSHAIADGAMLDIMMTSLLNVAGMIAKTHRCEDPKCEAQRFATTIVSNLTTGDFKRYLTNKPS